MTHVCSAATHTPLPAPVGGWRVPEVGDQVLFRADCAAELAAAVVVAVEHDREDPNVYADDDGGNRVLLPTPNPNVLLDADGFQVTTRQIRVAASPGWCWPNHDN
ncbi:hypothetical protein [Microtetraspora malaysiensis]|uniref:hypothetical protein n=1 Tax=Microtetraspora malaysiensis TaxID=161358 RepID=UPI003D8BBCEE